MVLKILVLTYFMGIADLKYYFYEDYIVKEYRYKDEEMERISSLSYEIYDLQSGEIHLIPRTKDQRNLYTGRINKGGWISAQTKTNKIETEKTMYSGYECIKETEFKTTDTPFGSGESRIITYFANVDSYLKKYHKKKLLLFLGIKEFQYKPYLLKIQIENAFDELEKSVTISHALLQYEEVDPFLPDDLMGLPIR